MMGFSPLVKEYRVAGRYARRRLGDQFEELATRKGREANLHDLRARILSASASTLSKS